MPGHVNERDGHQRSRRRASRGATPRGATTVGGLGAAGLLSAWRFGAFAGTDEAAASSCVLTPEVTEGPYWIDAKLTRRDIRNGKTGLPLELVFTVQNANTCKPKRTAAGEGCRAPGSHVCRNR
jgi:hypothetical protein